MKRLRLAAAVTVLALLAGCGSSGTSSTTSLTSSYRQMTSSTDTSSSTGALQGTIRRSDGATLSGVAVTVRSTRGGSASFTTASASDGTFAVGNMPPGSYRVTAEESGVGTIDFTALVSAGTVTSQGNCSLHPGAGIGGGQAGDVVSSTTGLIVGDVVDSSGAPVAGALVSAGDNIHGRTNRNGLFALGGLAAGSYTVTIVADGFADASQTATVTAGQSVLLQFVLTAGTGSATTATINVTVTDADTSAAVAGASLKLGSNDAVTAGSDGTYAFTSVRAGGYRLTVSATGYRSIILPLMVEPSATIDVPVSLAPLTASDSGTGTLALTVTDSATSEAISPAMVQIDDFVPFFADSSGQVTVTSLPAGSHTIVVSARGYVAQHDTVTITADSTTTYDVSLVARATGDPANGADGCLTPGPHGQGGPH